MENNVLNLVNSSTTNNDMAQYNVPGSLLEKLKCSLCSEHLSYPPILLYAETGSVCGRCPDLEAEKNMAAIRDKNYEDVANILLFPCIYKPHGCDASLSLQQVPYHEQSCAFKPYFCPIWPLGSCAWQGSPLELHGHFSMNHQEMLLEGNYEFELDIMNNYREHFLVPCFGELFILRLEFQNSDKLLRCCLHYVGNPEFCKKYNYQILLHTTDDKSWTTSKKEVDSDKNFLERTNESSIELAVLKEIFKEASFITGKLNIFQNDIEQTVIIEDEIIVSDVQSNDELDFVNQINKESTKNKFLDDIECPVCQEYMIPPIFQCITGHSICGTCKPKVKECPTCRNPMGDTRNFTLEKITESIDYQCKNSDEGCNFIANSLNIKKHEQECNFKPNQCPLKEAVKCDWMGNLNNLMTHCKRNHSNFIQTDAYFQTIFKPDCDRFEKFKIKHQHNMNFRIRYFYDQAKVACSVQCIVPPADSAKYMYEIQVIDTNKTGLVLMSKKYCGTLNDHKQCLKHSTVWDLDMVKPFLSREDLVLKFKCVIYKV